MGAERSSAKEYISKFDRVTVILPAGTKAIVREQLGMNTGPYITGLLKENFERRGLPFEMQVKHTGKLKQGQETVPLYRDGIEQISIALPKGTRVTIKQVLGMKASPFLAQLVEEDMARRGIPVDFSVLKSKKAARVDMGKADETDRVCRLFLEGYTERQIAQKLGGDWNEDTVAFLLKGAAYREGDLYEAVLIERSRRERFINRYGVRQYAGYSEENPLGGRVVSEEADQMFRRGTNRIWSCVLYSSSGRVSVRKYLEVEESALLEAVEEAWRRIRAEEKVFEGKWRAEEKSPNPLKAVRAAQMRRLLADDGALFRMLERVEIRSDGSCGVRFLDETEILVETGEEEQSA